MDAISRESVLNEDSEEVQVFGDPPLVLKPSSDVSRILKLSR